MRIILHIDFNSYFASVEQQANPHLRGKPIGVTGGDRMERTVLGTASKEAKRFGVRTGMQIWEAKKICPQIIIIPGDSDKYLEVTKRFLGILSSYSPYLEIFSIDEVFLELVDAPVGNHTSLARQRKRPAAYASDTLAFGLYKASCDRWPPPSVINFTQIIELSLEIKRRISEEVGEWITCSIGISYNKLMAKLAGSLQKPDGLVIIPDQRSAIWVLDNIDLDEVCGIGSRIKRRLNNMGIFNFKALRQIPLELLLVSFKSYCQVLYNMARGIDESPIIPFWQKEEVKSIGHRHTIDHDTNDLVEIKQILLKLTELIARRLRAKKLVGKTVHCWYREALHLGGSFTGDGMQSTIPYTNDGLEIFKTAWNIFQQIWDGGKIRMIGVSISNLKSQNPQNLSFLPEINRQEKVTQAIDSINDRYGEFTLQRGTLLGTGNIRRKPNPFLSDRRFKV